VGRGQIFRLSNALSLARIALLPFVLWTLWEGWNAVCLLLMLSAAATDWLDGYFARRLGQVSDLGKVLDPLADKVCIGAMCVALSLWRNFPWWATAIVVGRDLLILAGGLLLVRSTRAVPVSNQPGKWAAGVLAATIVCYAMDWQPVGFIMLGFAVLLAVVSGAWYGWVFLNARRSRP
jgi:CDP-diacylglycerol--glycerol-3-phosphate 3-phosphatidyltransferase